MNYYKVEKIIINNITYIRVISKTSQEVVALDSDLLPLYFFNERDISVDEMFAMRDYLTRYNTPFINCPVCRNKRFIEMFNFYTACDMCMPKYAGFSKSWSEISSIIEGIS